mgnify:CR=1 FL=1|tara:strand:+ start:80237 stop:80404 length:168 start_codon:yes stop_codon:yes gene_type:complete
MKLSLEDANAIAKEVSAELRELEIPVRVNKNFVLAMFKVQKALHKEAKKQKAAKT